MILNAQKTYQKIDNYQETGREKTKKNVVSFVTQGRSDFHDPSVKGSIHRLNFFTADCPVATNLALYNDRVVIWWHDNVVAISYNDRVAPRYN